MHEISGGALWLLVDDSDDFRLKLFPEFGAGSTQVWVHGVRVPKNVCCGTDSHAENWRNEFRFKNKSRLVVDDGNFVTWTTYYAFINALCVKIAQRTAPISPYYVIAKTLFFISVFLVFFTWPNKRMCSTRNQNERATTRTERRKKERKKKRRREWIRILSLTKKTIRMKRQPQPQSTKMGQTNILKRSPMRDAVIYSYIIVCILIRVHCVSNSTQCGERSLYTRASHVSIRLHTFTRSAYLPVRIDVCFYCIWCVRSDVRYAVRTNVRENDPNVDSNEPR